MLGRRGSGRVMSSDWRSCGTQVPGSVPEQAHTAPRYRTRATEIERARRGEAILKLGVRTLGEG